MKILDTTCRITTPGAVVGACPRRQPFDGDATPAFPRPHRGKTKANPPSTKRTGASFGNRSVSQRIRADLDMNGTRARALAAFHQTRRAIAIGAPGSATFPAGVRIVDAAVEPFGIEPHRVRDTQHDHLAVLQGNEAVVEVGGGDRNVLAEPNRIVLIDPGVVARLDAFILEALKPGARISVEFPAFGAVIARCAWPVERSLAQTPIETHEVPARFRTPRNTVGVNVTTTNSDARFRRSIELGELRLRIEAHEARLSAKDADRVPDRTILRIRHDGVRSRAAGDTRVLGGISWLPRFGEVVTFAIAVGVEDERRPADCFFRAAGLVEHPRVDPAGDRSCATEPQSIVSVVAELRMVGAEAGIDERVFHRLRVGAGHCTRASLHGE